MPAIVFSQKERTEILLSLQASYDAIAENPSLRVSVKVLHMANLQRAARKFGGELSLTSTPVDPFTERALTPKDEKAADPRDWLAGGNGS